MNLKNLFHQLWNYLAPGVIILPTYYQTDDLLISEEKLYIRIVKARSEPYLYQFCCPPLLINIVVALITRYSLSLLAFCIADLTNHPSTRLDACQCARWQEPSVTLTLNCATLDYYLFCSINIWERIDEYRL